MACTSSVLIWRWSARGCTVIPPAPARTHACTASTTLGDVPPRELRTVATLLTFTLRRITPERFAQPEARLWSAARIRPVVRDAALAWMTPALAARASATVASSTFAPASDAPVAIDVRAFFTAVRTAARRFLFLAVRLMR